MPPSSRRATRPRKTAAEAAAAAAAEVSDADTPESIATPSKSSRKRARGNGSNEVGAANGRAATRRKTRDTRLPATEREDTEGTEANEASDAETEPSTPNEEDVISKLKVADKDVNACHDFANDLLEGKEHVPGYGKIAGRTWTYIIQGVEINIGRPEKEERAESQEFGGSSQQMGESAPSAKSKISIDLGPDRQVSRLHAVIHYDSDGEQWYITVNGRNGIRLDTQPIKRGVRAVLRSGSVIDICGTQMAFITTARHEDDGPVFAEAIIRQTYNSEEEEDFDGHHGQSGAGAGAGAGAGVGSSVRRSTQSHNFMDGAGAQRFHPHSQATTTTGGNGSFAMPGTPVRSQQMQIPTSHSRPSPASTGYSRGVMLESTESIDYSADGAKDLKPPHSYAQLIGMAILSTAEQQMTLNNIYKWIMTNYAFYRHSTSGWQNSIRHNLSLNKAFEKIARRTDEPGKGMKWMIAPKERENFLSQGMKGCRRPNPLPSSAMRPSSGAGSDPSSPAHHLLSHAKSNGPAHADLKNSASPPNVYKYAPYPTATEAYTPDRGSRQRAGIKFDDNEQEFAYPPPGSAKSNLNHLTAVANAAGSPPSLYVNEDGRIGPLDTPFPVRSSQKLAPPSTLQRPSAFMDFSSPAPFWKFGSTPLRPLMDLSPVKTPFPQLRPTTGDSKMDDDALLLLGRHKRKSSGEDSRDDDLPTVQSSSPPPRPGSSGIMDASPTRSIPRPATSHSRTTTLETGARRSLSPEEERPASARLPRPASEVESGRAYQPSSAQPEAESGSQGQSQSQAQADARAMGDEQAASALANLQRPVLNQQPQSQQQQQQHLDQNYTQAPQQQQNLPQPGASQVQNYPSNGYSHSSQSAAGPAGPAPSSSAPVLAPAPNMSSRYPAAAAANEADDDAGIDLVKGFQPIGAFHKMGAHARFGMGMAGR